jgi:hypothetical protein
MQWPWPALFTLFPPSRIRFHTENRIAAAPPARRGASNGAAPRQCAPKAVCPALQEPIQNNYFTFRKEVLMIIPNKQNGLFFPNMPHTYFSAPVDFTAGCS